MYTMSLYNWLLQPYIQKYLGVPSLLEREVKSIIPLSDLQTQVSLLPGAGGHLLPVGSDTAPKGSRHSKPISTSTVDLERNPSASC